MRTDIFITKHVRLIETQEQDGNTSGHAQCASVMRDGDRIYSYGYHYPLLMRMQGADGMLWVLNDGGYSSTTSKHICWARAHADVSIPLGGTNGRTVEKADAVRVLDEHINKLRDTIRSKKRTDTRVYADLVRQVEKARRDYEKLTGVQHVRADV